MTNYIRSAVIASLAVVVTVGCFSDPGRAPGNNGANDDENNETNNGTTPDNASNQTTTPCEPQAEVCDGVDNDCDGEVDEGFDAGEACSDGLGACRVEGEMVCNDAGDGTVCTAVALEPTSEELCGDGIDNNCNGAIDEGFDIGGACSAGIGECAVDGSFICEDGQQVCDAVPAEPPEETENTCDDLDNDCDGVVDEGCDDDGDGFCDADFTMIAGAAVCPNGGGDCDDDDDEVYPGAPGRCDGKDNDCADGVDDIKRVATYPFNFTNRATTGLTTSPVQAIASTTGFCIHMTGGSTSSRTRNVAHYTPATDTLSLRADPVGDGHRVADIEWDGLRCGSLEVDQNGDVLDLHAFWWSPDLVVSGANEVVEDGIYHLAPTWDATLAFFNNGWVIGWTTASPQASYTTIASNFNGTTGTPAPMNGGVLGQFPEFGVHPGNGDLLRAANFGNIVMHQLDVGSPSTQASSLNITSSASREEFVMNSLATETWVAVRNTSGNMWELRRISPTLDYDLIGTFAYMSAFESQEFMSRNVFVGGPDQQMWFLDTVDEEIAVFADDGAGGLDILKIADPLATGHVLAGRQVSADVTQLLWVTDPSRAAGASFEVAEYTCH